MPGAASILKSGSTVAAWLSALGSHPTATDAPYAVWQLEFDYPPNGPQKMAAFRPSSLQEPALIIGALVTVSPEHSNGHSLLEAEDKLSFAYDLSEALNRDYIDFALQPMPFNPMTCPQSFQVSTLRFEDTPLSLNEVNQMVTAVQRAVFAGSLVFQRRLGTAEYGSTGGDFPFRLPQLQ